jgi:hypothetical protein
VFGVKSRQLYLPALSGQVALGCSERGALIDALRLRFAEMCNALLLALLASEESAAAASESAAAAVAQCQQLRTTEATTSGRSLVKGTHADCLYDKQGNVITTAMRRDHTLALEETDGSF